MVLRSQSALVRLGFEIRVFRLSLNSVFPGARGNEWSGSAIPLGVDGGKATVRACGTHWLSTSSAAAEKNNIGGGLNNHRRKVLDAALAHVNRHGWSKEALAAGAVDAGFLPVTHGLFRRGAAELAEYWMQRGNDDLREFLEEMSALNKKFRGDVQALENGVDGPPKGEQLVVAALFRRLQHTVPYLRSWPQAMALGLHPENVTTTIQRLHEIPELICRVADESEDAAGGSEWRERMGAVGGIYAAAELFMLTDYSEGYVNTNAFVQNRVRDSLQLEDKVPFDAFKAVFSGVSSLVTAAATMLTPIVSRPTEGMPSPFSATQVLAKSLAGTASGGRSGDTLTPPSPQEVFTQLQQHAEQAGKTVQNIASSPNPAQTTLNEAKKFAGMVQQHATSAADVLNTVGNGVTTSQETPTAASSASASSYSTPPSPTPPSPTPQAADGGLDPFYVGNVDNEESILETVKLPAGMSLFGLLSMNITEARAIVELSNPDFTVLVTHNADELMEPVYDPRIVRLMVDDNDIVVDTLRS